MSGGVRQTPPSENMHADVSNNRWSRKKQLSLTASEVNFILTILYTSLFITIIDSSYKTVFLSTKYELNVQTISDILGHLCSDIYRLFTMFFENDVLTGIMLLNELKNATRVNFILTIFKGTTEST